MENICFVEEVSDVQLVKEQFHIKTDEVIDDQHLGEVVEHSLKGSVDPVEVISLALLNGLNFYH